MRRFAVLLLALMLVWALPAAAQRPPAEKTYAAEGVTVELYQPGIQQGRAGLVRVTADDITGAQADVFDQTITFFDVPGEDGYFGFIVPRIDQPIRTYEMTVTATLDGGARRALLVPVEVRSGGFLRQEVTLPPTPELLDLLDPAVEQAEFALLESLTAPITPARYWGESGFEIPVEGELTSPFGAVRTFNDDFETWHTGWDFNGGMGDIMHAMADGRVAYSGNMDIRGGYVLIDHGRGVYSGYAHLSVMHVAQGQFVRQGQVIGLAGSTGRSTDPHLHVEMRVNGRWIDPVDFINMWVP